VDKRERRHLLKNTKSQRGRGRENPHLIQPLTSYFRINTLTQQYLSEAQLLSIAIALSRGHIFILLITYYFLHCRY
jgi:hypothetical protein